MSGRAGVLRLMVFTVVLGVSSVVAQNQASSTPPQFGGTYEGLSPAQRQLIDEWYADYSRMTGDHADPKEYNQYSLSTRTTYEAVTHALMTTPLMDKSGKSMGTALDLVQGIEAINGKVPRARGDLQFRMYVMLKPDALQKLKDSSEFFRDRDNTVYHKGFPLNYRQDGTPSIQFSMANDGRHADIDVDYRSSGIPKGLFNGHLTAANSDVRAGNNTEIHLQRWQGLTDWWHSLFGFPGEGPDEPTAGLLPGDVPPVPRKGEGKLEDAVQDFLQSWLVEQIPEYSAAYFSGRSFACLVEYGPQSGREINEGIAPYIAAKDLAAASKAIGKVNSVADGVQPESLHDKQIKPLKQPYATSFSLYQLSNGAAAGFECDPDKAFGDFDQSRVAGTSSKRGNYFASAFRLKGPNRKSDAITLVWTKEGKYWKVVSWEIEPAEAKPGATPDTRVGRAAATARPQKTKIKADPAMVQASHDFLHTWLVNDNYEGAAAYVSPRCNDCVELYLAEGEKAVTTPEEYGAAIRRSLTAVGKQVGKVEHLRDAMEPVRPEHEDLRVVEHAGEHAYTLVAVPDSLAGSFSCNKRSTKNPYQPGDEARKVYGNYYATLFTFRTPGEHAAALTLLWGKQEGQWKIISYEAVTP